MDDGLRRPIPLYYSGRLCNFAFFRKNSHVCWATDPLISSSAKTKYLHSNFLPTLSKLARWVEVLTEFLEKFLQPFSSFCWASHNKDETIRKTQFAVFVEVSRVELSKQISRYGMLGENRLNKQMRLFEYQNKIIIKLATRLVSRLCYFRSKRSHSRN